MSNNQHRIAAIVVTALITSCSVAQAQNLLTNPSFEIGSFTNQGGGFMILPINATNITGWTVNSSQIAWGTTPNSDSIVPFNGSFFLDLQGPGVGAPYGGVTQAITTLTGQQYHLSFYLGTQETVTFDRGPVSVSASAGGTTLPFTFNPGGTGTQWGQFGFDFTAASTSAVISIVGTGASGGAYIGLDSASVTIVPEPSTAALLTCTALMGAILRRKRKTANA